MHPRPAPHPRAGLARAGSRTAGAAVSFGSWQSLTGVWRSESAWGDFDGDGDPDLAYCGESVDGPITAIHENRAGTLVSGRTWWASSAREVARSPGATTTAMATSISWWRDRRRGPGGPHLPERWPRPLLLGHRAGAHRVQDASVAWATWTMTATWTSTSRGTTARPRGHALPQQSHRLSLAGGRTHLVGLFVGSADVADWNGDGWLDLLATGSDGARGGRWSTRTCAARWSRTEPRPAGCLLLGHRLGRRGQRRDPDLAVTARPPRRCA